MIFNVTAIFIPILSPANTNIYWLFCLGIVYTGSDSAFLMLGKPSKKKWQF